MSLRTRSLGPAADVGTTFPLSGQPEFVRCASAQRHSADARVHGRGAVWLSRCGQPVWLRVVEGGTQVISLMRSCELGCLSSGASCDHPCGDRRHPFHRSRLSVGVLRLAGAHDAAVALRRAAAVDTRDDRAHRGRRPVRRSRLYADAIGARLRAFSPLRNAVPDHTEGAAERHLSRPVARSWPRGWPRRRLEDAALRALQLARVPATSSGTLDDPGQLALSDRGSRRS